MSKAMSVCVSFSSKFGKVISMTDNGIDTALCQKPSDTDSCKYADIFRNHFSLVNIPIATIYDIIFVNNNHMCLVLLLTSALNGTSL